MSHLVFNELDVPDRKTKVFEIRNASSNFFLGTVSWRPGWRGYVFGTTGVPSDWSLDCLTELTAFVKGLMDARRKV